jgi:hypothetical protein
MSTAKQVRWNTMVFIFKGTLISLLHFLAFIYLVLNITMDIFKGNSEQYREC